MPIPDKERKGEKKRRRQNEKTTREICPTLTTAAPLGTLSTEPVTSMRHSRSQNGVTRLSPPWQGQRRVNFQSGSAQVSRMCVTEIWPERVVGEVREGACKATGNVCTVYLGPLGHHTLTPENRSTRSTRRTMSLPEDQSKVHATFYSQPGDFLSPKRKLFAVHREN